MCTKEEPIEVKLGLALQNASNDEEHVQFKKSFIPRSAGCSIPRDSISSVVCKVTIMNIFMVTMDHRTTSV